MSDDEKPLDFTRPDANGYVPDMMIVGKQFKHTGNGKVYVVTGFTWIGDNDEWGVDHVYRDTWGVKYSNGQSPVSFTRSVRNFFGLRTPSTGSDAVPMPRFIMQ